ncbi:multidrug transporter [Mycolicibacterium chitae]|uniref:Permease of the drug/metabolite transporter (DMT) superfamily n=1 Tax=Mycolicibacterium chitae TaxID=1792 RepID=A0A3S4TQZ7_MYCCI|nr:EamA family transporter [Mycolicibacterium chitae]MCV7104696.1 DMT family transporter [Mycolicibacterium chitae]BBZ01899.1 multidrug transporter [Mycolicibacterium chitae]VEG50726.1 permease of the drug/metabolite transporter (DMT) superfamily [Mycolicibacterium chitae]
MGAALALTSALGYGISDVLGGLASRRISPVRVALIGQVAGLCVAALALLAQASSAATGSDLAWGAASGIGTGMAMVFLFRGLSRGAMSVVVPVSAVGGVALPVLVSAAFLGERPPGLTWLGVLIALPALWFISGGSDQSGTTSRAAVYDGLGASGGIALQYLCLAQADASAGLWPILSGRAAAIVAVLVAAVTFMRNPTPRTAGAKSPTAFTFSVAAGVLAAGALTAYLYALRSEFVTVTVVLACLYPVVPVIIGLAFLGERLRTSQALGLAGALAATTLIVVA